MSAPDGSINQGCPLFVWPVRVYYEDTDAGGVVYHSNYIRFMERARTEFLRRHDILLSEMERDHRVLFAVTSLSVHFRHPARLDDALDVSVAILKFGAASIVFRQTICCHERLLVEADVRVAALSADGFRPIAVPSIIEAKLKAYLPPKSASD